MSLGFVTIAEAARRLGVRADTVRRWGASGRIKLEEEAGVGRLVVPESEVERLDAIAQLRQGRSNRFTGRVAKVKCIGLVGQVEIAVYDPVRVVALITKNAAEELELAAGVRASAIIKSTSFLVLAPDDEGAEAHG